MESPMEFRYNTLGIYAALSRRCDYARACTELAGILAMAFKNAPPAAQNLIYRDVLAAFRNLSRMEASQHLSAADGLRKTMDILPGPKRARAIKEYKKAISAQRRAKQLRDSRSSDLQVLSNDLLVHIFGFLDPRSLAMSSAVCRHWHKLSNYDRLWFPHFMALLNFERDLVKLNSPLERNGKGAYGGEGQGFWRTVLAWKLSKPGVSFTSNRVKCRGCKLMVWLSDPHMKEEQGQTCQHQNHTVSRISVYQVVTFVMQEPNERPLSFAAWPSDSDSDSDGFTYETFPSMENF